MCKCQDCKVIRSVSTNLFVGKCPLCDKKVSAYGPGFAGKFALEGNGFFQHLCYACAARITNKFSLDEFLKHFPELACNLVTECPADCMEKPDDTIDWIMHLNDDHKWSFTQIADWLEDTYAVQTA